MVIFFKFIVIAVAMLILIATVGVLFYKNEKRTSLDFATDAANDISVSWQVQELQKRAYPDMLENISKSGHSITEYFTTLNKLGVLKTVVNCTLAHSGVTDFPDFYIDANYICRGEYEKGPATLAIGLIQDRLMGPWQITNFYVNAPIFASQQQKQ